MASQPPVPTGLLKLSDVIDRVMDTQGLGQALCDGAVRAWLLGRTGRPISIPPPRWSTREGAKALVTGHLTLLTQYGPVRGIVVVLAEQFERWLAAAKDLPAARPVIDDAGPASERPGAGGARLGGVAAPSDRTGAPGRPTSRHLVHREFERRISANEVLPTVAAEAGFLADWLKTNHPTMAPMTEKSIQNAIRQGYNAQVRGQLTK